MTRLAIVCGAVSAVLSTGCMVSPRLHVHRAPRCEVQAVPFYYTDGTVGSMALNVCRFGPVGRTPDLAEVGDPYTRR